MMNFDDEVLFTVERSGKELVRTETIAELIARATELGLDLSGENENIHIFCVESNKKMSCKNEGTLEVNLGRAKFRFLGCK